MRDLVVVGGGPAGLVTALYAERAGLDVVVVERRDGALDKACGEGVMPGAVRALAGLGVDPPGLDLHGITYRQGDVVARTRFAAGPGRGVRRTALHDALRERVHERGVPVHMTTVRSVEQRPDHVRVDDLRARWVVAADGLHSPLRRRVGLEPPRARRPRWGLRRHYRVAPWTDTVEVTWGDGVEAYVTPVAGDTVGVAVLAGRRGGFDDHLAAFPRLREQVHGAPVVSSDRGAGPLRQDVGRRVAGRVLLVGDAAGYVDALTGEGIAVAVASARVLVDALAAGRPEDYERSYRRVSRPSRVLTSGLLWVRQRPPFDRAVVPAAARLPALFSATVDRLAG